MSRMQAGGRVFGRLVRGVLLGAALTFAAILAIATTVDRAVFIYAGF